MTSTNLRGIAIRNRAVILLLATFLATIASAQGHRKGIIDQDAAGPGGTYMQAILALINSPDSDVLGITVLTGDAWRDEEVQHTLRLLEIIGRTDIPVLPGAVFPSSAPRNTSPSGKRSTAKSSIKARGTTLRVTLFTARTRFHPCPKALPRSKPPPKTRHTSWCASFASIRTRSRCTPLGP